MTILGLLALTIVCVSLGFSFLGARQRGEGGFEFVLAIVAIVLTVISIVMKQGGLA